jgi:hypothetical protein
MRACTKCGQEKELDFFDKDKNCPLGRRNQCKNCRNDHRRSNYNPAKNRSSKLRTNYGLSLDDYDGILELQGGCCKICRTDQPGTKGRFAVDHNHVTNEVRGLLCNGCNIGLGQFKDNPDNLLSAHIYLINNGNYGKTAEGN